MKRSSKRTAALFLALALTLPLFFSCSESGTNPDETAPGAAPGAVSDPSAAAETVPEETTDGREKFAPSLPANNYEGYSFRIISRDDSMHTYPVHTRDLYAEEVTGDALNDAVFARNTKIEDTYGIRVEIHTENETVSETTPNNLVENSVRADSDDYDLLATHMIYGANSALKHVFVNYNKIGYIDNAILVKVAV